MTREVICTMPLGIVALRRLYHHLCHGGKTTSDDDRRAGFVVTKESLEKEIAALERENDPY